MYLSYFGLAEAPFSISPDPRYLYMTRSHQEALAHLLYGVNGNGGFVLLTGEIGAGKTTVSRCLLEQIPDSCDVAYVFNPKLTVEELLSTICAELGIACPEGNSSIKVFVDCINACLLEANAKGRRTVLIIDEAQNLSAEVLEQMRLLTNLETNQRKLLQIILLGQPELAQMLERPAMRQLAQRIVARYHLGPLGKAEVAAYVRHRVEVAGTERQLFPEALMGRLFRLSKGVPRVINLICDRALLGAYAQGKDRVDRAVLDQAAREVFGERTAGRRGVVQALTAILVLVAGGAAALVAYQREPVMAIAPTVSEKTAAALPTATADTRRTDAAALKLAQTVEWPVAIPRARSRAMAYSALLRAWGVDYGGGDACQQADKVGLRCRAARGSLDELRYINRPALVPLRDEQGPEFYAALMQLDNESATLAVGGEMRRVALAGVAAQWSGHYTVFWRLPPQAQETIQFGQKGPAVEWLGTQLSPGPDGAAVSGAVFDESLRRRVKQFQLAQGLIPDGVAGPQTLMRLSGDSDRAAPRLLAARGGR